MIMTEIIVKLEGIEGIPALSHFAFSFQLFAYVFRFKL